MKKTKMDSHPFRPMSNMERRAAWAAKYYMLYKPFQHPIKEPPNKRGLGGCESASEGG